jgi:two-component system phosphate regulon sensor histidine kinase PhoR
LSICPPGTPFYTRNETKNERLRPKASTPGSPTGRQEFSTFGFMAILSLSDVSFYRARKTMPHHDSGVNDISQALEALRRGELDYQLDVTDVPANIASTFDALTSHLRDLSQEILSASQSIGIDHETSAETLWDDLRTQVQGMVEHNQTMQSELIQISAEAGRVQSSLAERRRQLYMVISSMPNMLIILDKENRVKAVFVPPGFPLELRIEVLDTNPPMWDILPARLAQDIESAVWDLRNSGQNEGFEYTEDSEDQTYYEVRVSPVIDSIDCLVVINNITERRRQEKRLMQMKDDFISYASHEIRTPIYAIKGFLDLILSGKVDGPENQREFLQRVANGVERLSALASDLLDSSRIQSGQMRVSCQKMDIRDLIQEVVESFRAIAHIKELEIVSQQSSTPLIAPADRLRLHQVLINLLQNAMHYSQSGQEITVGATSVEGGVMVTVSDQGLGIPPQDLPNVFDKFFRVDSETNRTTAGSGLGLFISRSIIELHGGRIGVNSEPGKGSTFYFVLPTK